VPTQNEKRDDRDYDNNFKSISTSNKTKENTRIKKSSSGKVNKQTKKIINQKVIIPAYPRFSRARLIALQFIN
jgi:hypothetical protein